MIRFMYIYIYIFEKGGGFFHETRTWASPNQRRRSQRRKENTKPPQKKPPHLCVLCVMQVAAEQCFHGPRAPYPCHDGRRRLALKEALKVGVGARGPGGGGGAGAEEHGELGGGRIRKSV